MKKAFVVFSVFILASCWSGGKLDLWRWRSDWIESRGTYSIELFDQGPKLLKSELRTVKNFKAGKVMTAYKGYSIADVKTYRKDTFAKTAARINKDGALHSSAVPYKFTKNEQREVLGLASVDGEELYMVPSKQSGFVHLIRDDGSFYPRMGQIRHGKLLVIDPEYFATPESLRFEPVTTASSTITDPVKGFDIRFDGLKKGQIAFIYLDYAEVNGSSGQFENLYYENKKDGVLNIRGIKVKILHADNQKLDYIIEKSEFDE